MRFAPLRITVRAMTTTRFGTWHELRVIRERTGFSAADLAKAAAMSPGYLSDLEAGKRWPNAKMTKKLAVALNVPYTVLQRDELTEEVAS